MLWDAADTETAFLINGAVLCFAIALFGIMKPDRAFDRGLLGLIGIALLINYIAWRTDQSLPHLIPGPALVYQSVFLVFEMLTVICGVTSFIIMMAVVNRSREADAAAKRFAAGQVRPPVDVFICTYNEPLAILERAILCARRISYPNTTVWVCDDTRRAWLKDLCDELGVEYITRPDNKGAKAGNLNNALRYTKDRTNAPFLLVLDADFCVQPGIIDRILPLFEDETIGLVQTPQYFYNPDPIQHNLFARHSLCDDQRSFFDILQPSKDASNAAFCVGTSFIVRRSVVEEIGGFPDGAICEDLLLSYQLYRRGHLTRWLNERLSVGISAESIPEYLTQRTRWCLGTIQVGLIPTGPIFGRGYSVTQRAHYLQNLLCWMCKPFILLVLTAPAVFLWTGVPVYETELAPFLAAGLPCFIHLWGHGIWVSNGRGLPIMTEVVQSVTAIAIARTFAGGLVQPFGKPFKVTAKGVDRSGTSAHWPLIRVFAAIVVVTLAGIAYHVFSPDAPTASTAIERFNFVWGGFAILVSFLCILALIDRPRPAEELFDLDEATRVSLSCGEAPRPGGVTLAPAAAESAPATLLQASTMTAHVRLADGVDPNRVTEIDVPGVGPIAARFEQALRDRSRFALTPNESQRRELIFKLYAHHSSGVADTGSLKATLISALRSSVAVQKA